MTFTALHRALGEVPGPITEQLLDSAVKAGVQETDDLDWKAELLPAKGLPNTDFPKDVAAMANSGGGIIVYGVRERQKSAIERTHAGYFDENYERSLRGAAVSAISPPIFGLTIHVLDRTDLRAVVVEVPASADGPHLIYRNDLFGAPIRNDADTVWMRERQIEAMYRARFDERRHSAEALAALYQDALTGHDSKRRAWLIAAAHPRIPHVGTRLTRNEASAIFTRAKETTLSYAGRGGIHPIENVEVFNPRPGLRRWIAPTLATGTSSWKESWLSVHHSGAATLAAAIGGHRYSAQDYFEPWAVDSSAIEGAVSDFMSLVRAVAEAIGTEEYDVRVGIEWTGNEPVEISTKDNFGQRYSASTIPLPRFSPVDVTVNATAEVADFHWAVHDLAQDCVNQGGISQIRVIHPPERD